MNQPQIKNQPRYVFLDIIRCIAVSQLLTAHILILSGITLTGIFKHTYIFDTEIGNGVSLFLILSGLALELNYGNKSVDYKHFLRKRFFSIYPIYWICLFFGICIYFITNTVLTGSTITQIPTIKLSEWICSIIGMCPYFGYWGGPFLTTSWFISLIVPLYFMYPILSKWLKRKPVFVIILIFLISMITYLIMKQFRVFFYRTFPIGRMFEFSIGIFLAQILPKKIWSIFNQLPILIKKTLRDFSDLSFSLALIHYPLLFIFMILKNKYNDLVIIAFYLIISVLMASLMLSINKIIKKQRILIIP